MCREERVVAGGKPGEALDTVLRRETPISTPDGGRILLHADGDATRESDRERLRRTV